MQNLYYTSENNLELFQQKNAPGRLQATCVARLIREQKIKTGSTKRITRCDNYILRIAPIMA